MFGIEGGIVMRLWIGAMLVAGALVAACDNGDSAPTTNAEEPGIETSVADVSETTTPGPVESGGGASLEEPCNFVADAEMSEILGKEVTGQVRGDGLCEYVPAETGSGGIELLIQDVTETSCDLIFSVGGFNTAEPVEGVGTDARFDGTGIPRLVVCFDERNTLVATLHADSADPKGALLAVAAGVESGLS